MNKQREDIKLEEYVRTKRGFIGKVIGRHGGYGLHYELDVNKEIQENLMNGIVREDNITKHSFNIIDLIEVGDYVNGYRILNMTDISNSDKTVFTIYKSDFKDICRIWGEEDIETILTHEQFEANAYKV